MIRTGKVETVLRQLDTTRNPVLKTIVVFDDDGSRGTVYVKQLRPEVTANEILASLIGRSLGIMIPDPCVVVLDGRLVGDMSKPCEKYFGCNAIEASGFEQFLDNEDSFNRFISDYEKSFDVAVFDEWIFNDDRNTGNLIIDGKDIWFFDHDQCLPPDADPEKLSRGNNIFDIIQKAYSGEQIERSIKYYKESLYGSITNTSIKDYLDTCKGEGLISDQEYQRRSALLSSRIEYLSLFINTRFCVEQRDLF